jgi:YggT family protein
MGSVRNVVDLLAIALTILILGRVLASWVDPSRRSDASRFLVGATEPILGPIRRALPQTGGLDLSPMIVLIVLSVLIQALR